MSTRTDLPPTPVPPPLAETTGTPPRRTPATARNRVNPLALGGIMIWVCLLVVLPIAALVSLSLSGGVGGFWAAVTSPGALSTLAFTIAVSFVVTVINAVMGTVIAWVLVRDEFPGKRIVDTLIDLPFALPTIVASIVLLSLYGPGSPLGIHLNATRVGVALALLFVTLPFVVRAVQPVLAELDREAEEAAASLGANGWTIFTQVVWPGLRPAMLSGCGLAFARALGEFGSVVLIGGNIPHQTQVASQYIQQQIEIGSPETAAAVSVALLVVCFAVLLGLRAASGQRGVDADA